MVDKEIVLETVRKMYESGIEDDVVEQTLRDIGLASDEIKQYIGEAKGLVPPRERSMGDVAKPLAERKKAAEERPDQAAMHTATHVALEGQALKMTVLLEKIENIEKSLQKQVPKGQKAFGSSAAVNQRLGAIEKQVNEIKAELSATKSIMEKILETDRKVLNRL